MKKNNSSHNINSNKTNKSTFRSATVCFFTWLQSIFNSTQKQSIQKYKFKGEKVVLGGIVRIDLNNYSKWTQNKSLQDRTALLDDFFTHILQELDKHKGVYLRDEGDCLVAIFSSYFTGTFDPKKIESFCKKVVSQKYGNEKLSAKAAVAVGDLIIYRKSQQLEDYEWSVEGGPLLRARKLEYNIKTKKPCIYFFEDEYKGYFSTPNHNSSTTSPDWKILTEIILEDENGLSAKQARTLKFEYCN